MVLTMNLEEKKEEAGTRDKDAVCALHFAPARCAPHVKEQSAGLGGSCC